MGRERVKIQNGNLLSLVAFIKNCVYNHIIIIIYLQGISSLRSLNLLSVHASSMYCIIYQEYYIQRILPIIDSAQLLEKHVHVPIMGVSRI